MQKRKWSNSLALVLMAWMLSGLIWGGICPVIQAADRYPAQYGDEKYQNTWMAKAKSNGGDQVDFESDKISLRYVHPEYHTVLIVQDEQDLFSDAQTRSFIESAADVMKYANVCVVTSATDSYEHYAKELLDSYFGNGSDSTVFMINMNPRKIYIFSEGQTKYVLDKGAALSITDNIYRQASLGAYYETAEKALMQEARLLSGKKIFEPMKYIGNFFLAFMIAILVVYGMTFAMNTKKKPVVVEGIDKAVLAAMAAGILFSFFDEEKIYDPVSSNSSSSGGSGGGGGGGDSGAGGGHSF